MQCSICLNEARSLGFCEKHYIRFRKYGDPHAGKKNHGTVYERLAAKIDYEGPNGCWLWTGGKSNKGYGVISSGGKDKRNLLAHRVSYEFSVGPIPEGLSVLHSCDNPSCVNPAHLRCGTTQENIAEAYQKKRKDRPVFWPLA